MGDLLSLYNKNIGLLHPVQLAAEFHYKLVCILLMMGTVVWQG